MKRIRVIPNGIEVFVQSKGHWDNGNWGVVKAFDGELYHVAMNCDDNFQLVFERSELRVPKSQGRQKNTISRYHD